MKPAQQLLRACAYVILVVGLCLPASAFAAKDHLVSDALVKERPATVLSAEAQSYLTSKATPTVKVWVYFTDKGVFSTSDFAARAADVYVSEKAMARRAKMGLDRVVFADLPVVRDYVDKVMVEGGELRQVSRWLNAASFEIAPENLATLSALPFVAEITPVASFVRENAVVESESFGGRPDGSATGQSPDMLGYGNAFAQLDQINVPAVHDKGYCGAGVTLCILDTGYRKSHAAFAQHYVDGRVLGEWDFVFGDGNTANEGPDWSSQWNHGTYIWGTSGGYLEGTLYGPAYGANFLLGKTEDVRSETQVEEDNWVAAVEWADSAGADVITSSLGYSDWYTYSDFDGESATITIAANTADSLGILVVTSMGNSGPSSGTLTAPADAFNSLSIGAVTSTGSLASFSSRGPTFDGRTKPEVVARGVSTYCSSAGSDNSYANVNGTSLSTPLVAGAACLLLEARPTFTPAMIRQALMETADRADNPDNNYGWGLIDVDAALSWGASFSADVTVGEAPLTVQFTDQSAGNPTSWDWDFGDGSGSTEQHPMHTFTDPGVYDVALTVQSDFGEITNQSAAFVVALGDTLSIETDSAYANQQVELSVFLRNSQDLESIVIPFRLHNSPLAMSLDSVTFGARTSYFESMNFLSFDAGNNQFTVELIADGGSGFPPLTPGSGEIMRVYVTLDSLATGGTENVVDTFSTVQYEVLLKSTIMDYSPAVEFGAVSARWVDRGDFNGNGERTLTDLTMMVDHIILGSPVGPITFQAADFNADLQLNLTDLTLMVNFLFLGGPPPPIP